MNTEPNPKLREIAEKILKQLNINNDENFGSIIGILMIISIALTLIRVLQECNKDKTKLSTFQEKTDVYGKEIRAYSTKRGWFTKLRVKRAVKQNLSPLDYKKYGAQLVETLMDYGSNITDEDTATLVEAANV